jgi:hypothetical protein
MMGSPGSSVRPTGVICRMPVIGVPTQPKSDVSHLGQGNSIMAMKGKAS